MEDVLTFPPFQVERKKSHYRQVPVKALERLYSKEFGTPDHESTLACGSSVYGNSNNEEIVRLRRFSDVDYIRVSKIDNKPPYYKFRINLTTEIDVLILGYDSCRKESEDSSLFSLLSLCRFTVPLFDSEDLYLEVTSRAMSKILRRCLSEKEVLVTPSYAMMKISDARMYYQPHRWWSVHGEFILSSNANRNLEVYYDRVVSTMEKLCEEGSLMRVDSCYSEPVYDTSKFVRECRKAPRILDSTKVYSEEVVAFFRGKNMPTLKKIIIHVAYDGANAAIGLLNRKTSCTALFNTKSELVKVQVH